MKTNQRLMIMAAAILMAAAGFPATAQEQATADKAVVPLSDPSKPAKVEASLIRGSITVKGYAGKEVTIEAKVREKSLTEGPAGQYALARALARSGRTSGVVVQPTLPRPPRAAGEKEEQEKERSHEGMKLISAPLTGLSVEEKSNDVTISVDSWKYAIDMTIQVPTASSLDLRSMNDGNIVIENVDGNFELQAVNGSIILKNVSGNVIANSMNGDVEATIARISGNKPLSFSTMNGDIDVTLPTSTKADFKMRSQQGNIYSDFDVKLKQTPQNVEEAEQTGLGRYRISFDKAIYGTVNGGGQEISFATFTGDIFIRKGK
jgi:hypothetical protein